MTEIEKLTQTLRALLGSSVSQLLLYGALACSVWLLLYNVFHPRLRHRRIGRGEPTARQAAREMLCSIRSIAIFGLVTAAVVYAACCGWTRLYLRVDEYGWGWFGVSVIIMIALHDTYFYWTHRLMHHPRLYRALHHTHHRSMSPTPWAAYAFSTGEALFQAGIGPLIVFTIPVHPAAFALFMVWQVSFNVFGHCGYEIFPRWFIRSRAGGVLNSVTHHALHHEKFRSNFGLYFNVWDRVMGTNHPDYENRFDLVTRAAPNERSSESKRRFELS